MTSFRCSFIKSTAVDRLSVVNIPSDNLVWRLNFVAFVRVKGILCMEIMSRQSWKFPRYVICRRRNRQFATHDDMSLIGFNSNISFCRWFSLGFSHLPDEKKAEKTQRDFGFNYDRAYNKCVEINRGDAKTLTRRGGKNVIDLPQRALELAAVRMRC